MVREASRSILEPVYDKNSKLFKFLISFWCPLNAKLRCADSVGIWNLNKKKLKKI